MARSRPTARNTATDHPGLLGGMRLLLVLAAIAAFVLHARSRVEGEQAYRIGPRATDLGEAPAWLAPCARDEVARVLPAEGVSVFEPDLAARIARSFAAFPWVREVRRVEVLPPGRVEFELVVRRPAAAVQYGGTRRLIDDTAYVLPSRYFPDDRAANLPLIRGLGPAALQEGAVVESEPLRHGLSVVTTLRAEGLLDAMGPGLAIDVANVGGRVDPRRSEIVLVCASGTVVEWGRAPVSSDLNRPLDQKLAQLRELLRATPRLEGIHLVMLQFTSDVWRSGAAGSPMPAVERGGPAAEHP